MYFITLSLLLPTVTSCYWNDKTSYEYFGSKTPYNEVRGDIRDVAPLNGCEPISIWFVMRHGTRHPGLDDIKAMKRMMSVKQDILRNHAAGRTHLCAQDITNLQKWNWKESMDSTASELTEDGYQELLELGTRFHEKYYSLLENLERYHLRPSLEQRTMMSAAAFADGLGRGKWSFNVSDPIQNDAVLRPYKHCEKRTDEVINGPQIQIEMDKYFETKEFKQMLINVRKRIGIDYELTPQNVTGLYDLCRFYRAYSPTRRDPWCALFSNQELEIMEYVEDVRHYYRNGYGGGPINVKLGELPLKDLYEQFQTGKDIKSLTGYFTHDTMLEMVYSALGLYNDYPEISGFERVKNRLWRSSFNAPFAGNCVVVLNRCNSTEEEALKVQFFINEVEVHICKERACSWKDFNEKFSLFTSSNLDFCQSP